MYQCDMGFIYRVRDSDPFVHDYLAESLEYLVLSHTSFYEHKGQFAKIFLGFTPLVARI